MKRMAPPIQREITRPASECETIMEIQQILTENIPSKEIEERWRNSFIELMTAEIEQRIQIVSSDSIQISQMRARCMEMRDVIKNHLDALPATMCDLLHAPRELTYLLRTTIPIHAFLGMYFNGMALLEYYEAHENIEPEDTRRWFCSDISYMLALRADIGTRKSVVREADERFVAISEIINKAHGNGGDNALATALIDEVCVETRTLLPSFVCDDEQRAITSSALSHVWLLATIVLSDRNNAYHRIIPIYNVLTLSDAEINPHTPVGLCVYTSIFTPTHVRMVHRDLTDFLMERKKQAYLQLA